MTAAQAKIEPMKFKDIDAVLALENRAHAFPWTQANFNGSLESNDSAWILNVDGKQLGYVVFRVTMDEAELLNITISPDYQRRGYGMLLINHVFSIARTYHAKRLLLEVRPSNGAGIGLYQHAGFTEIGRRKAYYAAAQGREDAVVLAVNL